MSGHGRPTSTVCSLTSSSSLGYPAMDLSRIAAPMVNQSDLPFRILVRRYNATVVYTQMLLPDRLLCDQHYLEFHRRGLHDEKDAPVDVQLCGNDPDTVVKAARAVVDKADAIGASLCDCMRYCLDLAGHAKTRRSQPRMSSGSCKRRTLRRISSQPERLACGRTNRSVASA